MLVGSEIYIPINIEMKTARCKITEIKDELLEHVETTIHKLISYPDLTLFYTWPWEIWVRDYP